MDEEIREKPLVTGDALAQLIGQMKPEGVQTIFGVISKEAEELRLDALKREVIAQQCGVKDTEADSWQTAADVIKHFDMSELAKKHPQAAKNALISILSIFPPTRVVAGLAMAVPDDVLSGILGFSLAASPDHLVNMLVQHQAKVIAERNAAYEKREPLKDGKRNLAIVTKDELMFTLLKKLIETDDEENVGTENGTLRLVHWDEAKLKHRYKTDTIDEKVLIIGEIKGAGSGAKVMDVQFEQYGVKYGWIENCAYIHADLRKIRAKGVYEEFLSELSYMPVPEEIKADKKLRLNLRTGLTGVFATPLLAKDLYDDTYAVKRQMYFYGLVRFYYADLERFLRA